MIYGIPKFKAGHIWFALKPEDLSLVIGNRDIPTDMVLRIYDALFLNEDPELSPIHHKEIVQESGYIYNTTIIRMNWFYNSLEGVTIKKQSMYKWMSKMNVLFLMKSDSWHLIV